MPAEKVRARNASCAISGRRHAPFAGNLRSEQGSRQVYFRISVALIAAGSLVACGGEDRSQETAAMTAELDSAQIATMKEHYPRLGTEPLAEPRPSPDANPEDVPGHLPERVLETVLGDATYYADRFEGRRTASGIPFRNNQMVAAHRGFPFGTIVRVTNLSNDRSVNVRVVDRGPFGGSAAARRTVIDLSRRAANELGYVRQGRARVKVEVLEWGRGIRA